MDLHINTAEYGKVKLGLVEKKQTHAQQEFFVKPHESGYILEKLEEFLKSSKIKNPESEIRNIIVYKGGGSFTGLRIGTAVAQGLGLAWNVPIKVKNTLNK
ncbi:MAG: hypothetical protein JNN11_00040 [Candidatus Doudnabacteria bacterium]|nr:hypothetical protein [Candidatus Doudnabacteria bacterium]